MTENAKNPAAQKTIQDPPEYNAENAKNPKEASDWLGGPQNGNETPSQDVDGSGGMWSGRGKPTEAAGRMGTGNISGLATQTGTQATGDGYTKHRFSETPSEATMRYNPR
jgi:hypothetical protein